MKKYQFCTGAKINLGITIHGKAANGYHRVETVMAKIPLYDEVEIAFPEESRDTTIACTHKLVPNDEKNLLYLAYKLMQADYNLPVAQIKLTKKIPVGAGLGGGGSMNVGGLWKFLQEKFELRLPEGKLREYALKIGSDTAFAASDFSTVYERDHGLVSLEQIELPSLPDCRIRLIFQDLSLLTSEVYQQMDQLEFCPSDQGKLVAAVKAGDLATIAASLNNDFGNYIFVRFPQLLAVKKQLLAGGALGVGLSGKGPTLFALYPPGAGEKGINVTT